MSNSMSEYPGQDEFLNGYREAPAQQREATEQPELAASKKRKSAPETEAVKKPRLQENRAIFIENLPEDTDEDEIYDNFKKFGLIDKGADGHPRVKMYEDAQGNFTGSALLVFFKKESISNAITGQHNSWFRPEDAGSSSKNIRVMAADFSFKKNKDGDEIVSKMSRADKKASERVRAELNRQLADWSDDEEEVGRKLTPKKNVWQRICILRHAFTLEELAEDEEAIKDIKTEIRERASKFGDVSNVTLYDLEEQGIMTVKFREHGSAEKFCAAAEGMAWGDMRLESMIPEGRFRYRKTGKGDDVAPSPEDTTSTPEDSTSHE